MNAPSVEIFKYTWQLLLQKKRNDWCVELKREFQSNNVDSLLDKLLNCFCLSFLILKMKITIEPTSNGDED